VDAVDRARGTDQNIYLVMDDLGRFGRVWREVDAEHTDLETVIRDLLDGQYSNPVGVFGFNRSKAGAGCFRGRRPGNPPALRPAGSRFAVSA
jgi:hypothetical protein